MAPVLVFLAAPPHRPRHPDHDGIQVYPARRLLPHAALLTVVPFCRISQSRILSAQPLTIPRSSASISGTPPYPADLPYTTPGCFIRPGAFFIKFWGIRIPCIGPGVHFQVGFSRKSRPTALKFGRASYVDLPSGFLRNCVPYGGAAQKHHHTDQTVKYAAIFSTRQKLPVFLIKKTGEEVLPEPSGTMIRGQRFPIPPGEGCIVKV